MKSSYFCQLLVSIALGAGVLCSCSMKEEIRRIEAVKQAEHASESSRSTNLTGEQIFIRSCNTCHPGGRQGLGPSLADTDEHFKSDEALSAFLRAGKGIMPAQPRTTLNDVELGNLIDYLRKLTPTLKETK